jgi:hypothetical protein
MNNKFLHSNHPASFAGEGRQLQFLLEWKRRLIYIEKQFLTHGTLLLHTDPFVRYQSLSCRATDVSMKLFNHY